MSAPEMKNGNSEELVVIGSSAGGIGALSILVGLLPADFPTPIVLAQHLDPLRPSNLSTVLGRRSTLPVIVVEDGALLEAGKIYVVPANRHVTVGDGHVRLDADHQNRPRPSVDLLLLTAAKAYGDRRPGQDRCSRFHTHNRPHPRR